MANLYMVQSTAGFPSTVTIDGVEYQVRAGNLTGSSGLSDDTNTVMIDPGRTSNLDIGRNILGSGDRAVEIKFNGNVPANFTITTTEAPIKPTVIVAGGQQIGANLQVNGNSALNMTVGDNAKFGNISSTGGADTVTTGSGSTVGNVNLAGGENNLTVNGTAGTITAGSGTDTITIGSTGRTGAINMGTGTNNLTVNGQVTGAITGGNGADTVTVGTTGRTEALNLSGGNNVVVNNGTVGTVTAGDGNDQVTNNGTMGNVNMGGGSTASNTFTAGAGSVTGNVTTNAQTLTVDVGDGGRIGTVNMTNALIVNQRLNMTTGENVTTGDIRLDTGAAWIARMNLKVGDGSSVGNIKGATGDRGDDRIEIGQNVRVESIHSSRGNDTIIIGDNSVIHGKTEDDASIYIGPGSDNLTIGNNVSLAGNLITGDGIELANDSDAISIGEGSTIGGYIYTGGGNDTLTIGNNVVIQGSNSQGYSVHTHLGSDIVTIGTGVTMPGLMNQGGGTPNDDYTYIAGDQALLGQALIRAGYQLREDIVEHVYYAGPNSGFTYNGITYHEVDWVIAIPCFTRGTMIETVKGPVAIEDLSEGDLVMTADNGLQPIRWIGSRLLNEVVLDAHPNLRPIRIRRHALGTNIPSSDLVVSPQHRVLVRSKIAQKMFGTNEILVAAKQLVMLDGIDIATDLDEVEYFHILFGGHEVVISNGAETESLYTGPEALKSLGPQAAAEIFAIFPELAERDYQPEAARVLVAGRKGRQLAMRHHKNRRALVS